MNSSLRIVKDALTVHYVSMIVRRQSFMGKPAIALYIRNKSKQVNDKLLRM